MRENMVDAWLFGWFIIGCWFVTGMVGCWLRMRADARRNNNNNNNRNGS